MLTDVALRDSRYTKKCFASAKKLTEANLLCAIYKRFLFSFNSLIFNSFTHVRQASYIRQLSICRSTASRSPVLTRGGICVPPTVTYLPYRVSGSTLTAVGRSRLLAQWPGTLSRILSRGPTSSTDCFERLLKTYLFARYSCIQRIRGFLTIMDYALYKSSLTHLRCGCDAIYHCHR